MNENIKIRHIYKATELKRFKELEGEYHHMGETHSGGDTMRLVFESEDGEWLALMVWGSAVYHLHPRDEYIGWNMALRAARQKLVVNNRQHWPSFLEFPMKGFPRAARLPFANAVWIPNLLRQQTWYGL